MEQAAFIDLVRQTVVEPAISGTISQIENPTGRNLSEDRKRRSAWFRALAPHQRAHVEYAIAQAAHAATFGSYAPLMALVSSRMELTEATLSSTMSKASQLLSWRPALTKCP